MGPSPGHEPGPVEVEVETFYVDQRSDPEEGLWFFAYRITISNRGDEAVQLLSRHWIITNGDGEAHEVKGPGVVGEEPRLDPGESFRYTSACPLNTPVGTMHGSYQMVYDDGRQFDATVAPFSLRAPLTVN